MLKPRRLILRPHPLLPSQWLCQTCQLRLQRPYRQASSIPQTFKPSPSESRPNPPPSSPKSNLPNLPPNDEAFTPKPLSRPLGQSNPPKPGQNSGIDPRTWRERRDDFFNYDKHLERRKELTRKVAKPYFRDWTSMNQHRGKLWLSSPKLFKADSALYFPNMQGYTLANASGMSDTTRVLSGKISVVSVFTGLWAEDQTKTFVGEEVNMELKTLVESMGVQRVWINIEEDWMRAGLLRLFLGGLRKRLQEGEWGRYFVVRRGVEDAVRQDVGMVNAKIGYVYLVDERCRIRWAGSGDAGPGEREGLVACVRRLVEVGKGLKETVGVKAMKR